MVLLGASVLALAVGPLVYRLAASSSIPGIRRALDVLIVLAIAGLVVFHILPHSIEVAGWWSMAAVVVGLLGPTLLETWLRRANLTHLVVRWAVVAGIAVHDFTDGLALSIPAGEHDHGVSPLSLAVILHRIPVGLIIWWLVLPRYGVRAAALIVGVIAVATVVGYFAGGVWIEHLHHEPLALLEALIAGTLLHVAVHRHDAHHDGHDHG